MKVKDLILELYGEFEEPKSEAQREALERRVVIEDIGNDITLSIEEVKYDGLRNIIIIEVQN